MGFREELGSVLLVSEQVQNTELGAMFLKAQRPNDHISLQSNVCLGVLQQAIIIINHQLVDFNDRICSTKEKLANITPKARCTQRWPPALGPGCRQA